MVNGTTSFMLGFHVLATYLTMEQIPMGWGMDIGI